MERTNKERYDAVENAHRRQMERVANNHEKQKKLRFDLEKKLTDAHSETYRLRQDY
jgi:hypothetical protein